MKKIIILIGLIMSFAELYSQNIIDPPKLPINFNNTAVFDRDSINKHFIKGWNWGGPGRNLDEALNMNYYHRGFDYGQDSVNLTSSNLYKPNIRQIIAVRHFFGSYCNNVLFNAQSINLFPFLNVDSTNNFKPRAYDSSGAVFGFCFKNKIRILDSTFNSNEDYQFALLDKDSTTVTPDTVLKNAWNCNYMHFLNGIPDSVDTYSEFNGTKLYLTINLKSKDSIETLYRDSTILKIRLPYKETHIFPINDSTGKWLRDSIWYSSGYIKFDSLSNPSLDSIATIHSIYGIDRGKYKRLSVTPPNNKPTEFAITGEMLKFSNSNPADSSLTLSAFFICNSKKILTHNVNPFLNTEGTNVLDYINNVDIEVLYCGKINLGIKYIRLECPRAQAAFRGRYDDTLKKAIDTLVGYISGNSNGVRINRFYLDDEVFPRNWAISRYLNMLVDTLGGLETFTWATWGLGMHLNMPSLYLHATNFKEFFCGSTIDYNSDVSVPFIKYGKVNPAYNSLYPSSFYLRAGYKGLNYYPSSPPSGLFFDDTLNSQYETWLAGPNCTTLPIDVSCYDSLYCYACQHYNMFYGEQNHIEFELYNEYYKYTSLLYNDKPWWANMWIMTGAIYDTIQQFNSFTFQTGRTRTGEEERLAINYPIILGAKGLIYWFKTTESNFTNGVALGLQANTFYQGLQGDALIYSDIIGGDYVKYPDPNGFQTVFTSSKYDFNTMGIDSNRIYLGFKSSRAEINKIHKWITAVDDTLMRLNLVAWYGKGFISLYSQDPFIYPPAPILSIITDYGNVRTRQFGRVDFNGDPEYEPIDSSFYDVTLFRDFPKSYLTPGCCYKRQYYLGILNRRTSPLIQPSDSCGWEDSTQLFDNSLRFYSTADFDMNIQNGGNIYYHYKNFDDSIRYRYEPPLYWRNYYLKRQGCREMNIFIRYSNVCGYLPGTFLHIYELGAYDNNLNQQIWRQPQFYHKVDTCFFTNGFLNVRMLPGEAKILKLEEHNVLLPENCDACQYVGDTNQYSIRLNKTDTTTDNCCWDVKLINKGSCLFTYFPIYITFYGNNVNNISLTSNTFNQYTINSTNDSITYLISGILHPMDTVKIATICLPQSGDSTLINFHLEAVGNYNNQYQLCTHDWNFELGCPCRMCECCDNITYTVDSVPASPYGLCCDTIHFNVPDSCHYYGLNHYTYWNSGRDSMQENGIPTSDTIINFKYPDNNTYVLCFDNCEQLPEFCDLYHQFEFLDSNGNILCTKQIHIDCNSGKKKDLINIINSLYTIPNPAQDETTIFYGLDYPANISMDLYNFYGEHLFTIDKGFRDKGNYSLKLQTDKLLQGLYSLVLIADGDIKHIILIIIR